MKTLIVITLAVAAAGAAAVTANKDGLIRLTADEVQRCKDEGGCTVLTKKQYFEAIIAAMQKGKDEATCDNVPNAAPSSQKSI